MWVGLEDLLGQLHLVRLRGIHDLSLHQARTHLEQKCRRAGKDTKLLRLNQMKNDRYYKVLTLLASFGFTNPLTKDKTGLEQV